MRQWIKISVIVAIVATGAYTTSNIDPVHPHAWSENAGWLSWRDANGGVQGVRVLPTVLSGYIWAETVGFINVGDGTPAGGTAYSRSSRPV
ncbi:MAG: hypothetical protein HY718_03905 [Planctomycetes bacterium]|nr:hypothetical protein [Planctomycetota bacterium]